MKTNKKTSQLQIRVSPQEKKAILQKAKKANLGISEWVLSKALPPAQQAFVELLKQLRHASDPKYVLADIHDFLSKASADEFDLMVKDPLPPGLSDYLANYVTAMIEYTADQKGRTPPSWTREVTSLEAPVFGSDLKSLRLYLLTHSLPPFRRRNIFIDSSVGHRI
ncbi:MAG: hypothetical protein KC713_04310 [Candidatus Omnitrophica bacterium]|nr:hypothetical protein [Candidatus Omnitrophota bacterium]